MRLMITQLLLGGLLLFGCSNQSSPPAPASTSQVVQDEANSPSLRTNEGSSGESVAEAEELPELPLITFGGDDESMPANQKSTGKSSQSSTAIGPDLIIKKLNDLQILLGTWRGITQKEYEGSKQVDETEWIWDLQTNPEQPSLIAASENSPHYRTLRMTWLAASDIYRLSVTDAQGNTTQLFGKLVEPVENSQGDDGKPQRTYKLEFTQDDVENPKRYVFNQKNNNRYLLEVYQQRGSADRFFRVDTVSTQREGTSMALIDEGYGDKTCIISGGLGTITVSYGGESYYVCCTGCKAAFEEDPEKWIARAEENGQLK